MAASYNASAIKPKKHGEAMKKKQVPYTAQSGKPVSAAAGTAAADRERHRKCTTRRLAHGYNQIHTKLHQNKTACEIVF